MGTKVKGRAVSRKPSPARAVPRSTADAPPGAVEAQDPRAAAIRRAAFEAFVEHGVSGATTDEIARRAQVSKREIYRLFGSKEVLFTELVRERASLMRRALDLPPPSDRASALETLERFGREFLTLLTAPTTVAVYRLVIGEVTRLPELGRQLDAQGRGTVSSALTGWITLAADRGALPVPDVQRAAGSFMALLMGELPTRLMLGAVATPPDGEIRRRAALATAAFTRLWLSSAQPAD
ncbi:TetR/AcrR family transcriptional regulator [Anaeromyxobacter terrae]|uniref:TetR/AcrR family transcriptional regulator n=1 Tax=Anaeromyxobacter terrae TaxID=2925406 RepID=UPI001F5893B9|nr:TetR/AcrR family transcriptional regulator [Anaeromyxobacter sp. SG22]